MAEPIRGQAPSETAKEARDTMGAAEQSNEPMGEKDRLEQLCVDTIRFLAVDAVEAAKSGHPGTPMGMADMAFVLWTEFLRHDPRRPDWPGRDRFILSAGHASMLLYGLLHLTGYKEMTIEELKAFRQWGSRTAGHPEYGHAAGIEITTGPLGQGFAHGVGMGLAARMLAARFDSEDFRPADHFIYAFCSDGDLMEGISHEAGSLAGHLGLGNLIYFWDDNQISIEGETRLAFSEDIRKRFESYGWHVLRIDGHDRSQVRKAIRKAQKVTDRPSLICAKTVIGWGAPNLHGTAEAHGSPLGPEEAAATKRALGWPAEPAFLVPEPVRAEFARRTAKLARSRKKWEKRMKEWHASQPHLAEIWDHFWSRELPEETYEELLKAAKSEKAAATRALSGKVLQRVASLVPFVAGGSADLAPSNNTMLEGEGNLARESQTSGPPPADAFTARNLHFGVREHTMAAMVNGMVLHGGWRAYGGTFLIFSDYMRPSIRLAALMGLPSIFVFTHDSVFLGEDGPTHQPIEHLFALRLIPNLHVFRPADGAEVAAAWTHALSRNDGPTAIALTRQKLEPLPRSADFDPAKILKGAYVLESFAEGDFTIMATGSEVPLAVAAASRLAASGMKARVVSAPCLELFTLQSRKYQDEVLGRDRSAIVAIEAGRTDGWYRWAGHEALLIGLDRFGASAPYEALARELGFTPDSVVERIQAWRAR
ncbi:MAG TPA: transketolase [Thermoanaerobaculia bacterium]|nr:transketolase [Thermoanaerobaculia bacterium]